MFESSKTCVNSQTLSVWRDFLKRPAQRLWVEFSDEKTSRLAKEKLNWLRYILQSPSKATGDSKGLKDPHPTLRIATSLSCVSRVVHFGYIFSADLSKTATDGAFFKHSNLSLLGEEKEVCLPCTKLFWCYTVLHTLVTDKQHCLLKLKEACSESRKLIL